MLMSHSRVFRLRTFLFFLHLKICCIFQARVKCLFARLLVISANIKSNNTTRLKHTYGTRVAVTDVVVKNKTLNYFQIAEINIGCTEHDVEHTYRNNKTKNRFDAMQLNANQLKANVFIVFIDRSKLLCVPNIAKFINDYNIHTFISKTF